MSAISIHDQSRLDIVEEIVGFDLGHGETALSLIKLNNANAEPDIIEIDGKKNNITAIGYHPEKGILLGERAVITRGITESHMAFKKRPDQDQLYQKIVKDYVATITNWLIENRKIEGSEKTYFFVGCPSDWVKDDTTIENYERLLSEAGLGLVTVVPESRAALMHAKESEIITNNELQGSVLVLDMGSSTTDLTLVEGGSDAKPFDVGCDLGSSLIDKEILRISLESHPKHKELVEIFSMQPEIKTRCELQCRKVKEEYFRNPDNYEEEGEYAPGGVVKSIGGRKDLSFDIDVDGIVMRQILGSPLINFNGALKSWIDVLKEILCEVKEGGFLPNTLLLTGGASRMDFIKDVCSEVFPEIPIKTDNAPEFCIARGLARWGRVHVRTQSFVAEINETLEKHLSGIIDKHSPELLDALSDTIAKAMIDEVLIPRLKLWRSGHIETLSDLESDVIKMANSWLESIKAEKAVASCIIKWVQTIEKDLGKELESVCQKYGVTQGAIFRRDLLDMNIESVKKVGFISFDDPTVMTSILSSIVAAVLGLIIAVISRLFIVAGWLGWIAGFIAIIVGYFAGYNIAKDMNIWQWVRNRVSDKKIDQMGKEKKAELKVRFREMLDENPALIKQQVKSPIENWLKKAIQEQADKARLLIR